MMGPPMQQQQPQQQPQQPQQQQPMIGQQPIMGQQLMMGQQPMKGQQPIMGGMGFPNQPMSNINKGTNNTWAGAQSKVNISLEALSPVNKLQKQQQPSMNQLQQQRGPGGSPAMMGMTQGVGSMNISGQKSNMLAPGMSGNMMFPRSGSGNRMNGDLSMQAPMMDNFPAFQ